MFNPLELELVARMEALAGERDEMPYEDGTTTLMCEPVVAYDAQARYELSSRCPRGVTYDELVIVLLEMVNDGYASVFRDGHAFYFEGRPH